MKRIVKLASTGVVAAVAGVALLGQAQQQDRLTERFHQVDRNADGKVTPAELPQPALFKELDLDADGVITLDEARRAIARGALKAIADRVNDDAPAEAEPVRQGPKRLSPAEHGVGRYVPDVAFQGLDGSSHKLSEFSKAPALVAVMTSTSCPLSKKYLPTVAELTRTFTPRGVAFLVINPVATDKPPDMQQAAATLADGAVYVHDRDGRMAAALGATTTTDVVVLDASRTVVYHGAIDDQYGFGYALDAPRTTYLIDALLAVLAGRKPAVEATEAPGCTLERPTEPAAATEITYHNQIARLMQRHCVECHREGGVAPFSLTSYEDVVAHAGMIRQVVQRGVMPPWFAAPPAKGEVSPWANDRSLAESEKQTLTAWLDGGKPLGDPQDAPQPRTFADGWLIGKPDAVFEFSQPIPVKATGTMPYQNVVVETNLPEDKWVQAIEVRPGAVDVVHHVLIFARAGDDPETPRDRDDGDDERMGYWGIYVPGNSTLIYPEGYAKRLPKGAKLRFQMHYTPNGTATEDRTRVGLIFARQPPKHEVRVAGIVNTGLRIPPGAGNHREVASLRLPLDVQVLAFLPHMHLRGKAARYEVITGDDQSQLLLDIPRYDFNWQLLYRYAEPLTLRRGQTLRFTAWFDNSANNPANPDPTKTVRWGPQTFDEMHLGYVEYIVPGLPPGSPTATGGRLASATQPRSSLLRRLDTDGDGSVSEEELKQAAQRSDAFKDKPRLVEQVFRRLDANSTGKLEPDEFNRLRELLER